MIRILFAAALLLPAFMTNGLQAEIRTFDLAWSGASFGNNATATGTITIDDTVLPNPSGGLIFGFEQFGVTSLTVTVSGAFSGNGTFTLADFIDATWDSGNFGNATLDLTSELVGQATVGGPWGTQNGAAGEFTLFSFDGLAPTATGPFEIATAGGSGDRLLLTNFTPTNSPPESPIKTYDLEWSGASFGNNATAIGSITIDTTILPNPSGFGQFYSFEQLGVLSLTLTVSGASSGNGTFTLEDFADAFWDSGNFGEATLDLTSELVGQPTGQEPWGVPGNGSGGEFALFTSDGRAPTAMSNFVMATAGGAGDSMELTSFKPADDGLKTFDLAWSGASFGNNATAIGSITIDTTVLPNPSGGTSFYILEDLGIVDLTITISGAASGNGTFTMDDFLVANWDSGNFGNTILDLTEELVGQATGGGDPWGTPGGFGGAFSLLSFEGPAPTATESFELTTAGGSGDRLSLTNFTPVDLDPPELEPGTFIVTWSGASFGNTATATALVVIDDSVLPNPNDGNARETFENFGFTSFTITVTGATLGNGTFTEADFDLVAWNTGNLRIPLNLTEELVGQPTSENPWGTSSGGSGDFNVFSAPGSQAPNGTFFFQLSTDEGFGDRMLLTSFAPAFVTEPEPVILGDVNRDGVVSSLDITPFISLISVGDFQAEADTNQDGTVDFLDIVPFIALLSS